MSRKRNFALQERYLLLEIIKSYKQILENKKTDNASAATKKEAWNMIAEKYNSSMIVTEPASGEQLRRLWQNLKTRQREALTKERQYRMSTGGGGPCPDADIDPDISEIAPALLVEIPEANDSDFQAPHLAESNTEDTISDSFSMPQATQSVPYSTIVGLSSLDSGSAAFEPSQASLPVVADSERLADATADEEFSNNEKKIRVQILKKEYLNREKRAEALHNLHIKFLKEKHDIEMKILQQNLRQAEEKADSAQK